MAIVAEYHYPNGTVCIDDDCYRDVPPEEMQRRIERLQKNGVGITDESGTEEER